MKKTSKNILIIGGVAAGPAAAAKAKRINPNLNITLFEQGEFISYGTCSMPYYVGDVIPDYRSIISFTPEEFEKEKGCTVKTFHRIEEILPHKKKLVVSDLQANKSTEYPYDQLLIATGARARIPNPAWLQAKNVFSIKHLKDSIVLKEYIASHRPRTALILGGGFIGMEMAEAFSRHNLDITILHKSALPMNTMEPESQKIILDELQRQRVKFIGNTLVSDIQIQDGLATKVMTTNGTFTADLILLALGFEPNTAVAKAARIRCGASGGIVVDSHMRTNIENIYAAGACTEIRNRVSHKPIYLPLGNIANRMGRIAGENIAGEKSEFQDVIRTTAVKIFDLEVASVGLRAGEAEYCGFRTITESIMAYSRSKSYPGAKPVFIKFIVDKLTKRLIGADLIAEEGAAMHANILSVAIQNKMTLSDISHLDLLYSPPFSPVWDPILVAANQILKKLS
jgi:NADPH-dependent 2,4-dienoyl-CoA reductase/sulfur reductase-like enzyme